jgi:hypothetical protein
VIEPRVVILHRIDQGRSRYRGTGNIDRCGVGLRQRCNARRKGKSACECDWQASDPLQPVHIASMFCTRTPMGTQLVNSNTIPA